MYTKNGLVTVTGSAVDSDYPNRILVAYLEYFEDGSENLVAWDGVLAESNSFAFRSPAPLATLGKIACVSLGDGFGGIEKQFLGCVNYEDIPETPSTVFGLGAEAPRIPAPVVALLNPNVKRPPSIADYAKYVLGRGGATIAGTLFRNVASAINIEAQNRQNPYVYGVRRSINRRDMEDCNGRNVDGTPRTSGPVCHYIRSDWNKDQVASAMQYVHFLNVGFRQEAGEFIDSGGPGWKAANAYGFRPGRIATTLVTVNKTNGPTKSITDFGSEAAVAERSAALLAGQPYKGVVGHLPDRTWLGMYPYCQISSAYKPLAQKSAERPGASWGWLDQDASVNSSFGAQSKRYPDGYEPTEFRVYLVTRAEAERKTNVDIPNTEGD